MQYSQQNGEPWWHPNTTACQRDPDWNTYDDFFKQNMDVSILLGVYSTLLVMGTVTLLVRICAARCYNLPLFATHVWFLLFIIFAISLRIAGLVLVPCTFTINKSDTVMNNLLANTPLLLMFTIFTMLLYHTFIVVHSIHLSYEPVLSRMPSAGSRVTATSASAFSPLMPRSLLHSLPEPQATRSSWGQSAASTFRSLRRCDLPFWIFLCGRPYSSIKLLMIALNVVMWTLFLSFLGLLIFDAREKVNFPNSVDYLLEIPAMTFALLISLCFIASGTKLLLKLRVLRKILAAEDAAAEAKALGNTIEGSGSDCVDGDDLGPMVSVVLSTFAPPSLDASLVAQGFRSAPQLGTSQGSPQSVPVDAFQHRESRPFLWFSSHLSLPVDAIQHRGSIDSATHKSGESSHRFSSHLSLPEEAVQRRSSKDSAPRRESTDSSQRYNSHQSLPGDAVQHRGSTDSAHKDSLDTSQRSVGTLLMPSLEEVPLPSEAHLSAKAGDESNSTRRLTQDSDVVGWNSMQSVPDMSPGGTSSIPLPRPSPSFGNNRVSVMSANSQVTSGNPSGWRRDSSRGGGHSIRTMRSSVRFSTMTASLAMIYDEPDIAMPSVIPVMSGVKRMLIVVCTCVGAFFFRAGLILYCLATTFGVFPRKWWLPYLTISEAAPYALLLLFYFIPGCQAIAAGTGCCGHDRRLGSSMAEGDENLSASADS